MCSFKLLIVEDNEEELVVCKDTVHRYKSEKDRQIQLVECKTLEEAFDKIDNSFDGVIIDLKLGPEGNEGNKVIQDIHTKFRIPVAILTGTPSNVETSLKFVPPIYTKGKNGYDEILDYFFEIYDTGITRIFGGRGTIEDAMNNVFWNNIYPQIGSWKNYTASGQNTEKALLRFTINHLLELLNDDSDFCYPEEMYISPLVLNSVKTGCIVLDKKTNKNYLVMSPACDLVIHSCGSFKTDRILLCEIEDFNQVKDTSLVDITKKDKRERRVKELIKNTYTEYYHWLPSTTVFHGGFINFRWTIALEKQIFERDFKLLQIQVSSHFVKDIVSRFAAYYARQGQPDFDFDALARQVIEDKVVESQ